MNALSTGVALSVAACGGGGTRATSARASSTPGGATSATKGGTLYYLTKRPAEHLDPQRTYIGRDLADTGRIWSRSLVQFPTSADPKRSVTPIPDLATDTGTSSKDAKTWTFTLKDGVTWEDGKGVTCADVKYGVSRTFAPDVITGGPNYVLSYLPSVAKAYAGPYKKTGQAAFDKAITCSSDNKTIAHRLIADSGNDQTAVTDRDVPPAFYNQITGPVAARSGNVDSPLVSYLVPNFNTMTNPKVRQALALATNKAAYSAALGGPNASVPGRSIVNPAVPGYAANPAFTAPDAGDPAAAEAMLRSAGVTLPYPIKAAYPGGTPTADNSFAALKQGWDAAGFKTTLVPLPDTYYDVVEDVSYKGGDVLWGGWGADWPGLSTVIPALFDSRINLGPKSNGQDFGIVRDAKANAMMDLAADKATLPEQTAAYTELDRYLGESVAYIPIDVSRFYLQHGSNVTDYLLDPATNMYPDLGAIGVGAG